LREVYALSNIRVKFERGEEVKYISHLDLMKLFERALRRSRIPIAYSKGFNPHPQMVFGLPLSVGVTSQSEFADFELDSEVAPEDMKNTLNKHLPQGIRIVDAAERKSKSNIMASITGAQYDILVNARIDVGINEVNEVLCSLLKKTQIFVEKESKGKVKQVDIRPMIHTVSVKEVKRDMYSKGTDALLSDEDVCKNNWLINYLDKYYEINTEAQDSMETKIFCFSMLLSAGSVANLKPELLIVAIKDFSGFDLDIEKIHRSGLFVGKGNSLLDPLKV
jgi:radical SAM-linked protein